MGLVLFCLHFVFDLVDFYLIRSARRGGVLELLLVVPAWRADGNSNAIATATAATP